MAEKNDNKTKSTLDSLFDVADQALGGLEGVLKPSEPAPQKQGDYYSPSREQYIDAEYRDTWSEYWWAVAHESKLGEAWHVFKSEIGELKAECGSTFTSDHIRDRQKLDHGKRIVACTSCIIAVSKHG